MADTLTTDPAVVIEDFGKVGGVPWVIYRNIRTGRRWRVSGECDMRGNCWVGAINRPRNGPGGKDKTTIDIVITPEFALDGCCPFTYAELPAGPVG